MKKILLIDDDELVRYSLTRVLTAAGYEVIEAADGFSGLRQFRSAKPDLVLTDVVMPEQDGLGVLNELRSKDKDIPIVVMSGGGEVTGIEYLSVAEHMGANAVIAKPFDNATLLSIIQNLLAGNDGTAAG